MNDDELTHVQIKKGTRRRLRVWKAERDLTYDEAVNELIRGYRTPMSEPEVESR